MGRQCEVSGKKTVFGNQITHRGFKPNLQTIKVWLPNGTTRYVRVATSVIRTGMLTLEVDGKVQTFPLIKASRGSSKARAELKSRFPIWSRGGGRPAGGRGGPRLSQAWNRPTSSAGRYPSS